MQYRAHQKHVDLVTPGVDDILAGFYVKDDGRVNPVDATMALAKGKTR
jgi:glycine/D-amino acid oxidase-like deaminating enzyme